MSDLYRRPGRPKPKKRKRKTKTPSVKFVATLQQRRSFIRGERKASMAISARRQLGLGPS